MLNVVRPNLVALALVTVKFPDILVSVPITNVVDVALASTGQLPLMLVLKV